jgi:hypothetical protein
MGGVFRSSRLIWAGWSSLQQLAEGAERSDAAGQLPAYGERNDQRYNVDHGSDSIHGGVMWSVQFLRMNSNRCKRSVAVDHPTVCIGVGDCFRV